MNRPLLHVDNRAILSDMSHVMLASGLLVGLLLPAQANVTRDPLGERLAVELGARIPPRPADAVAGAAFGTRLLGLKGRERDAVIVGELSAGNVPPFLRRLEPIYLSARDSKGNLHQAVVFVTPDYLSVGSNEDFLRVPLGFDAAVAIAHGFGFTLPTRKIVDTIYQQSSLRLAPKPMPPGPQMTSTAYFVEHNRIIEQQRQGQPLGVLVSGHKKDLVLTKRLLSKRGRVAIYGWHRAGGRPIQPLSTVHVARYADYSHGVRLVSTTVLLDGRPCSIFEIFENKELAPILTYEGVIHGAERLMAGGTRATPEASSTR